MSPSKGHILTEQKTMPGVQEIWPLVKYPAFSGQFHYFVVPVTYLFGHIYNLQNQSRLIS